jgi:hypothetical protein
MGGFLGPRPGLDGLQKKGSCLTGIQMPDRPARILVAKPTTLPRLQTQSILPENHTYRSIGHLNVLKGCDTTLKYVKRKVKVSLEQATMAQRGSRGIALLFL